MRFSGHETFPIRDGWLHKGLALLLESPVKLASKDAPDLLGVGKNMARSIRHWLHATRLAERDPEHRGVSCPTAFGRLVAESDPYFVSQGTWWMLHINLVSEPFYAGTWGWFFNYYGLERFDKATAVENLRRYVRAQTQKVPSPTTLDRDVTCLLSSYAKPVPPQNADPEESRDCPFLEFGLLSHYSASGYYQAHRSPVGVSPQVLGYCLAIAFADSMAAAKMADIKVTDAAQAVGGPGRAFGVGPEGLYEIVLQCEANSDCIGVVGHAGSRAIRIPSASPTEWASMYYATPDARKEECHVAC